MASTPLTIYPHQPRRFWPHWVTDWQWFANYGWLALPLLALVALAPFYREGLPRSYDGGLHLLRIGLLDDYLRQGMLYPRWAPALMLGQGYPVFSFYGPSTYYLVEALHLLGLTFYASFIGAFSLLIGLAGYGMYWLARDTFGKQHPWAAWVAAVAYMYAPYLLTNLFIRGAIAEVGAQALLPWIFWSSRRLFYADQPRVYLLPVALSLGGLAITHNITLLFVPPVLLSFMALHWWQSGHSFWRLRWALLGLLAALGISAFFWLPLVIERRALTETPYLIARTNWLPLSVWTWQNFLDYGPTYTYTFARPIRLGLLQAVLALAGFAWAWRRDWEWRYWGLVAIITAPLIGQWTLPIWQSSDLLAIAQFPWRLLSILSLPLALLTGGLVLNWRWRWLQGFAALLVVGLLIFAHQPRLQWIKTFPADEIDLSTPVSIQLEVDKGAETGGQGNSSVQEFRPRWADSTLELDPATVLAGAPVAMVIHQANAFDLAATVTTTTTAALRFQSFYFPGWQVWLDGETQLRPYPSTNLGLLTVDLPAGVHQLQLTWTGTALQHGAGWFSLLTLLLLSGFLLWYPAQRWLTVLPAALLIFGLAATVSQPPRQFVRAPIRPIIADGLQLLGYRWARQADVVYLYPYWYATHAAARHLQVRWQLQDMKGHVRVDSVTVPYFNSYRASNIAPGTLFDDAYTLTLPPDLPAGQYQLAVGFGATDRELDAPPKIVGDLTLTTSASAQARPSFTVNAQLGKAIRLAGFDLTVDGQPVVSPAQQPPVVESGQSLTYRLYWQALAQPDQNYHGLIHLLDHTGQALVKEDQLPGPFFHPPLLWDRYRLQTDSYRLRLPKDAPSGLYWPAVGMYDFATVELLPVRNASNLAEPPTDLYRLPPVKIVNRTPHLPQQLTAVRVGNFATLLGYDLSIGKAPVYAGEQFTVTLYYRSNGATAFDYTRFVHLYSAALGMVAQNDSPPQAGNNPTWSWAPGEVIVDPVTLEIPTEAKPGVYSLWIGLYDPKANDTRVALFDAQGHPLRDNQTSLLEIIVQNEQG